jgi:Outer membrane protein beta-barrel domain
MKKTILSIVALLSIGLTNAQKINYGFKAGLNISMDNTNLKDHKVVGESDLYKSYTGFHLGGFIALSLNEKWVLQPELLYSTQGFKNEYRRDFSSDNAQISPNNTLSIDDILKFSYLNLPIMFQYKPISKLAIEFGPQLGYMLAGESKHTSTNTSQGVTTTYYKTYDLFNLIDSETGERYPNAVKRFDFSLNLGASYDITKNVFAQARYNMGLTNIRNLDPRETYDEKYDLTSIKNSVIQLSVGYKF